MAQFVQLQKNLQAFHEAGIGVVGLTYDSPKLQQKFADKNGLEYPLISDVDAYSVKALDILNTKYEPGDRAYGIPYPGIFVLDSNQKIVGKVFIEGYKKRVHALQVLEYAKGLLDPTDSSEESSEETRQHQPELIPDQNPEPTNPEQNPIEETKAT